MRTTSKKLITAVLFLTVSICAEAENFRLGLQATPQLSWFGKSDVLSSDRISGGLKYGLEADIFLGGINRYAFNTGLFVSHNALNYRITPDENAIKIGDVEFTKVTKLKTKMNFIEIPLNIKLCSDEFDRFSFYGQFGLTTFINVSTLGTSDDKQLSGKNVIDDFARFNAGMLMGAGAEYDLGRNTSAKLGIEFTNGFADMIKFDAKDDKTSMNSLRLVFGIIF